MNKKNPLLTDTEELFIAGTGNLAEFEHRLCKQKGSTILFCHNGQAKFTIDLKEYEIKRNSQVVLLPNSVLSIDETSKDFHASYFTCSGTMFAEAVMRLESTFFQFIKNNPHYILPEENTGAVNGLMKATYAIYIDRENRFRNQIAKNHLQSFLLDIYDKVYRFFSRKQIEGGSRQNELFGKFMQLIHKYSSTEREVSFYANELCISTKYLTGICRNETKDSAKKIIDDFMILEIKVLLQSTELTVQEIADKLNFPDQSYLGRYFKRHEGISPMEYRKKFS